MLKFRSKKQKEEELRKKQQEEEKLKKIIEKSRQEYEKFEKEIEEDFGDNDDERFDEYYNIINELGDDFYLFIYRSVGNLKDSLIVASFIREIDENVEDIQRIYKLDDKYVDEVLTNNLPIIRQKAYDDMEYDRTHAPMFFSDLKGYRQDYYKELTERIEYFFEIRRNNKKLEKENFDKDLLKILKNSRELNYLLNFLSVKDSLLIAYELNLIDLGDYEISDIYDYEQEYIDTLLKEKSKNIIKDLEERIQDADKKNEKFYNDFDYGQLANMYIDIENRIEDTLDYFENKKM